MGLGILIALVFYIILTVGITGWLVRKQKKPSKKIIVGLFSPIVAILIPIWDIPIINWKFEQLCKDEAGVHVYEEVVLVRAGVLESGWYFKIPPKPRLFEPKHPGRI
jgi:hypothetical protein